MRAMAGTVVITYLELAEPDPVRAPARPAPAGFATRTVRDPGVNREMYRRVGADYQWVDRLPWSDERWASYAARVETHLVELDGRTAGYFELELDSAESAKIALFGLLEEFHGIGLGGHALTAALNRAPRAAAARVADHLHARRPVRAVELPGPRHAPVPHRHAPRPRVGAVTRR